ncbi:MAG: hypothetical protein RL199_2408, partial [Pseudomonadota bacterium]
MTVKRTRIFSAAYKPLRGSPRLEPRSQFERDAARGVRGVRRRSVTR